MIFLKWIRGAIALAYGIEIMRPLNARQYWKEGKYIRAILEDWTIIFSRGRQ